MCSCRILQLLVFWVVLVLILHGCSTGPAVDVRIDFDRFKAAAPSQAHCPGQDGVLKEMETLFAHKNYTRALHLAAEIIQGPCSMENYTRAVKIAGDVFAARKEYDQAFYYYLEGLSHAVDAGQEQMFFDSMQQVVVHLPPEQVRAMVDTASVPEMDMLSSVQEPEPGTSEFHPGRIGVLLPLTGYYQAAGERAMNGIQMAVDARNRSNGSRFELKVQDTRSDPEQVAVAVQRLGKTGVACIIGPMVTARPAAVQAQALEIPMITLTQQSGIPETGEFVFRNFITPEDQASALIAYVVDTQGHDRFAVFYPDEKYGHVYKQAFLQAVEDQGGQVTAQVMYAPGQTDFSAQIKPLIHGYQKLDAYRRFVDLASGESREKNRIYRAKTDFDAVFIPDGPETGAQISQQLRFHDIRDVILLGTNIWNPEALAGAGGSVLPAVFPVDFDPDSLEETVQNFVVDYEVAFGEIPDYFAAIGFETAMLVMDRLSDPEVTSRAELMQALKTADLVDCGITFEILGTER